MDARARERAAHWALFHEPRQERPVAENRGEAAGFPPPEGTLAPVERGGAAPDEEPLQFAEGVLRAREGPAVRMASSSRCLFCGQSLEGERMSKHIRSCIEFSLFRRNPEAQQLGTQQPDGQPVPTLVQMYDHQGLGKLICSETHGFLCLRLGACRLSNWIMSTSSPVACGSSQEQKVTLLCLSTCTLRCLLVCYRRIVLVHDASSYQTHPLDTVFFRPNGRC